MPAKTRRSVFRSPASRPMSPDDHGVRRGRPWTWAALLLPLVVAARGEAQAGIRLVELESIRVDGAIGEWRPVSFTRIGSGPDASMRFALAHDGEGLYVAAQVWDERVVRTPRPGPREDALILTLAVPHGRGLRGFDFYLFAGVQGRSRASAAMGPVGGSRLRPVPRARVVEGPLDARGHGYTLEAFIPFAAIPGAERWDRGRGSIRLRDVDSEAHPEVESEPSLSEVNPRQLDRLLPLMPTGGAVGALEQFLHGRGLGAARVRHDLRGDVAGDARPERVFVVDRYLVVTGPGYRSDGGYAYLRLPVDEPSDVREAYLRDLTGDGKAELVMVLRQRNAQGERDLWQVVRLSGEAPQPVFGVEIRKAVEGGSVQAEVRVLSGRRRPPEIEVRVGDARGLDAERYRESPATDAEPMLVPWGPVVSRRYRWSGDRFERTGERPNPRYRLPSPPRSETTDSQPAGRGPEPLPSTPEALLADFRRQYGVRRGTRPRFSLEANLAGDRALERAQVYGRVLVVVGPGIEEGRRWMNYEVPVARDEDLLDLRAADVTGDGVFELLFRIRQTFDDVQREILLVHRVVANGFPRLLQVEVARQRGDRRIENQVRTEGGRLVLHPGRARGWTEGNWPFSPNPNDTVDPLLLPWRDRPVRYRLQGTRLTR